MLAKFNALQATTPFDTHGRVTNIKLRMHDGQAPAVELCCVVTALAEDAHHPVSFFCSLGKDNKAENHLTYFGYFVPVFGQNR